MRKAALALALVVLGVSVLLVGDGVREHLGPAPQAGLDLGQGARRAQCLDQGFRRAEACEGELLCGVGAGVFTASCMAVAEPDGSCDRLLSPCSSRACEQVLTQARGACEAL
jgi:hypothetical protein